MKSFDTNRWYPIASASDLPSRHVYQTSLAGQELAVWRDDNGNVNAWENRCPHRGLRLTLGVNLGHELRCQYHGWTYETGSGGCTFVPAHRDATEPSSACVPTFAVREKEGLVWASLGTPLVEPEALQVGNSAHVRTLLRSLPFNASQEEISDALLSQVNKFAECVGGGELRAEVAADGIIKMQGRQDQKVIIFFLQPYSNHKAVVHTMVFAAGTATLAFKTQFSQVFTEFRRSIEASHVSAPKIEQIRTALTPATDVPAVVVPFPRAASTEFKCVVTTRLQETEDIISLWLKPVGRVLPQLSPGMHISVTTPAGPVRQYSVVNSPDERDAFIIGIKREPASRGGSQSMHEQVAEGTELAITVPRNAFPLLRNGKRPVLIAGGIGITPILAMAQALQANSEDFELHYFARGAEHIPFGERLRALGANLHVYAGLDAEATRVKLESVFASATPSQTDVYTCGPAAMINCVSDVAAARGIAEESIRFELFKNEDVPTGGAAFEVELAKSGKHFTVSSDKSLLKACWENGVNIEASCEQGVCGTCMTGVLSGDPEHHDTYLSKQERESGKWIMPCVSRCKNGKIVLDL
ncbi:Rieske 2Fe-2S domain-containing protein [Cupriavidus taiwanensis]|uniref:Oxidoreductase NdmD n=1 Tax=Cupriavidus taiwanensis TaxID=164546 RepID=A0A7Z7JFB3_9BURK|nr:Rieske 2Fe-2S domain-containing protein [Cupriavidus taiwanensis]SOZ17154.1 Oxidoreductase NdmD [Cupriavidus taiwanensis]SOZ96180.1 Oxidoreductase NdmD [Cupriavidus taiwanensis]SPC25536.1 Oxidoreductase NdmD [Cupriavidus taiwanensis]